MLVRHQYSEEAVWRETLGNSEPLYCFSIHGECLDAPENMPAVSTTGYTVGKNRYSNTSTFYRDYLS